MTKDEQRRLRLVVCYLQQAQDELNNLGFTGVADHVRFCANDVKIYVDKNKMNHIMDAACLFDGVEPALVERLQRDGTWLKINP